ncbi:MAG: alpha/beta hydrolase family protein, partial [Pseudarthrobacter sp.]
MSRSEKVTFEGSTGETLSGIIDVPEGPVKGWGVFSHGFTLGKDSPSASRMCKALADSGVGMLRFDNLGLGGSAGEWSAGSFSHKVADTVKAAEFMRAEGKQISLLVGHSFGGAAVLAAAREIPELDAV